jgi:hypothetical protein
MQTFNIKETAFLLLSYFYKLEWQDGLDLHTLNIWFPVDICEDGKKISNIITNNLLSLSGTSKKLAAAIEYLEAYGYLEFYRINTQSHTEFGLSQFKITVFGIEAVENFKNPEKHNMIESQFNFKVAENMTVNNSLINLDRLFEFLNTTINTFKK